jgi:hypothetical protein
MFPTLNPVELANRQTDRIGSKAVAEKINWLRHRFATSAFVVGGTRLSDRKIIRRATPHWRRIASRISSGNSVPGEEESRCVFKPDEIGREVGIAVVAPFAQRCSIATVGPSTQPSSRSRCSKAAVRLTSFEAVVTSRKPTVGSLASAFTRKGHASVAPLSATSFNTGVCDAIHGAPSDGGCLLLARSVGSSPCSDTSGVGHA